jgi:hypothetical protein
MDPTTVKFYFNGEVLEQNYKYDLVSMEKILRRYVDKDIQLVGSKGEVLEGTLLSIAGGQVVLKKRDGGLIMLPNVNDYRFNVNSLPEGLMIKPTLECLVDVKNPGAQDVLLSYQTGGLNWSAEYVAVLDDNDKQIDLNSWVSINNQAGITFENVDLRLVAGDVNRTRQQYSDMEMQSYTMDAGLAKSQFQEESFFEYHIYDLQRKSTLANNETKQISLFENKGINVEKKFIFNADSYGDKKVKVYIEFMNKEDNHLGVPMPKGRVRLFKMSKGALEFIGEDNIDHTAKDERVKLLVGNAFDLKVEGVQTDNRRITDRVSETSWKYTLRNHKKEAATIELRKSFWGFWDITKSSLTYEKLNANSVVFKVTLAPDEEKELTFTVRHE